LTEANFRGLMKLGASRVFHSKQKACGPEYSVSTTVMLTPPMGG